MLNAFPDHIFHMISIFILFAQLRATKTVLGLSIKTQELYLLVFITKYIDIIESHSMLNSAMKVVCVLATAFIIYTVHAIDPYKTSYLAYHNDTFQHVSLLVVPCIVLTALAWVFLEADLTIIRLLWIFSVLLETVAMVPQIFLLYKYKETENLSMAYVFFLGVYRGLFVLNYVYRSYYDKYFDSIGWIEHVFGTVQTVIYAGFFIMFIRIKYKDSLQKIY